MTFSGKSAYGWLKEKCLGGLVDSGWEPHFFKHFWKIKAPPKVITISWKVLRDKIPSKRNLVR